MKVKELIDTISGGDYYDFEIWDLAGNVLGNINQNFENYDKTNDKYLNSVIHSVDVFGDDHQVQFIVYINI